jgi:hypothetical protein
MERTDLQSALQQVMCAMFARNRSYFGGGGPDYYGVEVVNVASDGAQFDLILTFKSGTHYCCTELVCHFPFAMGGRNAPNWIKRFHAYMSERGFSQLGPITINNVRVIVEEGVFCEATKHLSYITPNRYEYDDGPFHEVDSIE